MRRFGQPVANLHGVERYATQSDVVAGVKERVVSSQPAVRRRPAQRRVHEQNVAVELRGAQALQPIVVSSDVEVDVWTKSNLADERELAGERSPPLPDHFTLRRFRGRWCASRQLRLVQDQDQEKWNTRRESLQGRQKRRRSDLHRGLSDTLDARGLVTKPI